MPVDRIPSRSVPNARDRHGRGLRRPLLPAGLPGARSRSEQFDDAVLQAAGEIEARWPREVAEMEFAVDDVPPDDGPVLPTPEVVLDGPVALCRFDPPALDRRGRTTKARVVLYRRPIELRAGQDGDLADIIVEVLVEQLSAVLGSG